MRPLRSAALLPRVSLLVVIALAGPVSAQEETEPAIIDELAGDAPRPTRADLAGSVRLLEPGVRLLKPVVRSLQTERRRAGRTTVTISSDVLFAFDSPDLTPQAREVVQRLAARIARARPGPISVVGHTDSIGSRRYNQRLSEQRAASVARALRRELPPGRRIRTAGRNFSEPVAPNELNGEDNPAGRARNRRVEIAFDEKA